MPSTFVPCRSPELAELLLPIVRAAGFEVEPAKMAQITPLIQERIRLLNDVLTVGDFFFLDELAPYDAAELIPKKGDARAGAACAGKGRAKRLAAAEFTHDGLEAALARGGRNSGHQSGPDVRARTSSCLRAQNRAAAFRYPRSIGQRHLPEADRPGYSEIEIHMKLEENAIEVAVPRSNFIREIILDDLKTSKYRGRVHTRFPPEPNGYLHIGHAKSICLNFGLAAEFGGKTNLRFDDTNPEKEEQEYVDSIMENVRWLGFDWEDRMFYASDYFGQLYEWARQLVRAGKAYVCDLSAEEMRKYRGTLTEPGTESPYRNRSVEENLDLFDRMRKGEFPDGSRTLRAKIDMASPNLNMRDPVMYRILHAEHHRTGNEWCIYPMYDFAHGQSDSIEGITHSICTLEFEDHRPLYDWYIEQLGIHHPQQIEFDRLNITYTLLSKRKLLQLVEKGYVRGWDDPRMPTISGIRRRGYTPEAIRNFCNSLGVSKTNGTIELRLLEHHVREDLNKRAPRMMAVLRPLRVVIDNYPEDGRRRTRSREQSRRRLRRDPPSAVLPRDLHRAGRFPGRSAEAILSLVAGQGSALALCVFHHVRKRRERCERRSGGDPLHLRSGHARRQCARRTQSEIHHPLGLRRACRGCRGAALRHTLHERRPECGAGGRGFHRQSQSRVARNPHRMQTGTRACQHAAPMERFQFERLGYFCVDPDTAPGKPVFNRTVALKDTWAKIEKRGKGN